MAMTYSSTPVADAPASPQPKTSTDSRSRPRGSSFSFLRKSKSNDAPIVRTTSEGKTLLTKRRKSVSKEEAARQAAAAQQPTLPRITPPPLGLSNLYSPTSTNSNYNTNSYASTSGSAGYYYHPSGYYQRFNMDSAASQYSNIPVPPIPEADAGSRSMVTDPLSRSTSITHRGRYSYASSAISDGNVNSPRRIRRRKDPTPFNVLVIGAKNCGKTSFIEFLRTSLARPIRQRAISSSPPPTASSAPEYQGSFTSHYLDTELDGERIGLTLWDSKGLERHLVDLQLRELSSFVESKFQETFNEEQKVLRSTGVRDTHIHCVFLILDPSRLDANIAAAGTGAQYNRHGVQAGKPRVTGNLDDDLDVGVLRALQGKTTVVPVISKSDTVTTAHMSFLKRTVSDSLKKAKFDPLEALNIDSDNESEYDTADEASIHSDYRNGDDTINATEAMKQSPEASSQKPFSSSNSRTTNNDMLSPSPAPRHDDIRISTMSENVDLPMLPMSIISPDVYDPGTIGRRFPWGYADPNNSEHCDFVRLKETVFSEWRGDLRTASREKWYEGWRTARLRTRGSPTVAPPRPIVPGPRTASGAATYGGNRLPPVNGTAHHPRVVSSSEIGVAIGGNFTQGPQRGYVKGY